MRVVALVAAYNEEVFIVNCIESYLRQNVEVLLIDNDSDDKTVKHAKRYLGKGLLGVERVQRSGTYEWSEILSYKEALARSIRADWFIHADPDEMRLPPSSRENLCSALQRVQAEGCNAVNFQEFTFLPTAEHPNHAPEDYLETMRWYYPFLPRNKHRVNAWRPPSRLARVAACSSRLLRGDVAGAREAFRGEIDLASSGGHQAVFKGVKLYPEDFKMKHYLCLSREHAIRKYCKKNYSKEEVRRGWHGWRAAIQPEDIRLPSETKMRTFQSDDLLDTRDPLKEHLLFAGKKSRKP